MTTVAVTSAASFIFPHIVRDHRCASIFLFSASHHNLERIVGQWPLQCLREIPRRRIYTSRSSSVRKAFSPST
jgi:hypothetical protein